MRENLLNLLTRVSTPSKKLSQPGPSREVLLQMLEAAVHVPDHGRLQPWRFVLIEGANREKLSALLAARRLQREPNVDSAALEKDRTRFNFAPTIIVAISVLTTGHKVPVIEQQLSGGAVCMQLLLAADAAGFGAQWLTGWAAYDEQIKTALGLLEHEKILGFIHIGTASEKSADRARASAADLLTVWPGTSL
jgi:nitroreductase